MSKTAKKLAVVLVPIIAAALLFLLTTYLDSPSSTGPSATKPPRSSSPVSTSATTTDSSLGKLNSDGKQLQEAKSQLATIKGSGNVKAKRCASTKIKKDRDKSCTTANYNRKEQFGEDWGGTGCWNTRDKVLKAQLSNVKESSCHVTSGVLDPDPYTGDRIEFVRGPKSAAIQIDHIYPLSLAWSMGAAKWTQAKRINFANDLGVQLVASDGPTNVIKSDKSFYEWVSDTDAEHPARIPNKATECTLAMKFVNATNSYDLNMLDADYGFFSELFSNNDCASVYGTPATDKKNPAI